MKRKTIRINEDACIGCGQCANACHQGAIQMIDGKAKLVNEDHCDGLGRCLGTCPVDAISFIETDMSDAASPASATPAPAPSPCGGGCPGTAARNLKPAQPQNEAVDTPSALEQWPIQLHLINPASPQFTDEDLLIAASCTAFSCGGFHSKLLKGKKLVIACPKLDNQTGYQEKLNALFLQARPRSVTIARMEVPCCMGLTGMAEEACAIAGNEISTREIVIGLDGEVINEREVNASAEV